MKRKLVLTVVAMMMVALMGGCSDNTTTEATTTTETEVDAETEEPTEEEITEETEFTTEEPAYSTDDRYGEFELEDGGKIAVTLTDQGRDYYAEKDLFYVEVIIENIGDTKVTYSNSWFEMYGDDFEIDKFLAIDDALGLGTISPGRKVQGRIYGDCNIDSITKLELVCGGKSFVLFNKNNVSDPNTDRNVTALDKDTSTAVIPNDIQKDVMEIPSYAIAGSYGGVDNGNNWMSVSMYTSEEEGNAIGNADINIGENVYSFSGEIEQIDTNVYRVATTTGDSVIFGVTNPDDTYCIFLYINGELMDQFFMMEAYES